MGDVMTEIRSSARKRWLPVVLGMAALVIGCASSTTSPAVEEQIAADSVSTEVAAAPAVSLQSMELVEGAPGARLALQGSAPLVWTSYRDTEGHLVVELPNTVVEPTIEGLAPVEGLIAAVEVGGAADGGRPLARLRVVTREEADHTVTSDGENLEIRLVPLGETSAVAALDESWAEPAVEPMPQPEIVVAEAVDEPMPEPMPEPTPLETAPEPLSALESPRRLGTPDAPSWGPEPAGITATRLDAVDVTREDEATLIRLYGDGGFRFSTFYLENPPRFVVDLDGVHDLTGQSTYAVGSDGLVQVRVAQFQARPEPIARVVFDLEGMNPPSVQPTADGLLLRVGGPAPVAVAEATPPEPIAEEPTIEIAAATAAHAGGAGTLEDVTPPVEDAWIDDASVPLVSDVALFEAQDTEIPAPAVGAPVVGSGSGFAAQEVQGGGSRQYYGEPMSLSLKDADIKDVLRSFSKISGLNIVVQPGVRGTVTVELESVPWDQALEQILKVNQLGMVLEGNILRIAPLQQLRQEAQEEARLRAAQSRSQPLRTVIKRLSYARAQDLLRLMSARRSGVRVMSSRGKISVDRRTNTLIIKELPSYMDTVISIIEHLDSPEPQVMIEARIVETVKSFNTTLGIQWGVSGQAVPELGTTTGLQFPNTVVGGAGVNLFAGGTAGLLNLTLGNATGSFNLDVLLAAFESQGLVNVLSAPRIATLNNERASIQSGLQIPVQTVRNNTVTVQYINATLRLEVTPQVTAEGTILMDIRVQKREPDLAFAVVGATNAPINTKEARTNVMVRDGGTTVIGGIYEIEAEKGEDRVPGLANIPILGHLFRNKRKTQENSELLIFITPRVIQF